MGATGQLGTAFRKILPDDSVFFGRADLDLRDLDRIGPTIAAIGPTAVINCAAYTDVDRAETAEETANVVNGYAVGELAAVCRDISAQFITFSTDYVFDGTKDGGYVESDTPNPINAYGRSKLLGEHLAMEANPDSLIVRTSWLLSGTHSNFVSTMIRLISEGDVTVVDDQSSRPTLANDLAPKTMEALAEALSGILHLANDGITTWYELAMEIADLAGLERRRVHPCSTADYPTPAQRPLNSVLESQRTPWSMPTYDAGLARVVEEILSSE
jgi:dTDP-4-dehydrorhamnose reductase